jgi:hypothetical protein
MVPAIIFFLGKKHDCTDHHHYAVQEVVFGEENTIICRWLDQVGARVNCGGYIVRLFLRA